MELYSFWCKFCLYFCHLIYQCVTYDITHILHRFLTRGNPPCSTSDQFPTFSIMNVVSRKKSCFTDHIYLSEFLLACPYQLPTPRPSSFRISFSNHIFLPLQDQTV